MKPLPADFNELDVLPAALVVADAGYFVFPVRGRTAGEDVKAWKAPLPGLDWDAASTRDPKQIREWWAGTPGLGIGVDCGKTGLVVLDEDHRDLLPADLLTATLISITGRPGRHFVYRQPDGRRIGNSTGKLPKGFGEVRGDGGYFVIAPSPHPLGIPYCLADPTIAVAPLPAGIADLLPDRDDSANAATDEQVREFIDCHNTATRPGLLRAVVNKAERDVAAGAGRHPTAVAAACWAMREAAADFYSAAKAEEVLGGWFAKVVAQDRDTDAEWSRIVAFAVAQATEVDPGETRARVEARFPRGSLANLWEGLDAYLEAIDRLPFLAVLATAVTAVLDGEPLWLLLVGAPSGGKTEAIRLVETVADDTLGELTGSAPLLAWTKGKNPRPSGMLTRIPPRAFAVIRDLSPLLASSDRGGRDELYAKLRDVYDGRMRREVGQQPEPLTWEGRLTLTAAVTPAIDNYSSHARALGDRWLYMRLAGSDDDATLAKAMRALDNDSDHVGRARARAQQVAAGLVARGRELIAGVELNADDRSALAQAALVVSRARAVVPRHGYGRREIDGVPVIEETPRLARQLGLLVRGLISLGLERADALGAGVRAAIESVPKVRAVVLNALADREPLTGAEIARRTGLHRQVVRMQLEELETIGVVQALGGDEDDSDDDIVRRTPRPWALAPHIAEAVIDVFATYREEVTRSVESIHTSPHI